MMSAVGRDRLLFLWHWLDRDVVPKTSAKDLLEARIITSAKAIKITSGRIALQSAEYHKNGDGDKAVSHASAKGGFHRLRVVHLAVAHRPVSFAKAFTSVACLLDKTPAWFEIYASIPDVLSSNRL